MADNSGTLGTNGAKVTLIGGKTPTYGFLIHNPHASADLWLGYDGVTASANGAGCHRIPANGGEFRSPDGCSNFSGPVTLIGTITSQPYTAKFW